MMLRTTQNIQWNRSHTHQAPFTIRHKSCKITSCIILQSKVNLKSISDRKVLDNARGSNLESIVGPGSELEVTTLIIEWEPSDVNLASGLEYSRRDIEHGAIRGGNNIGLKCTVKSFISAETKNKSFPSLNSQQTVFICLLTKVRYKSGQDSAVEDLIGLTCYKVGCPVSTDFLAVSPHCPLLRTLTHSSSADNHPRPGWTTCRWSTTDSSHPGIQGEILSCLIKY